ncbi:FecR domain-containing protein [Catenovulum sp. 2E275]|uniref:FecR family protein n=1 Tax=Catenovulum sp. 2E275 TaxID=2980497 RepID=UPI0021D24E98|nr:FecR domain-containing protein [Catenovulum sp. 2E275]MCU4675982.1 FecR domain-containing protein [Catenovulum sp. 2E275]
MKNNVIQMSQHSAYSQDKIDEQALHWLMELDRGDMSEFRKLELVSWINLSDKHKQSLLAHAKLWDELDVLSELADIIPYQAQNTVKKPKYYLYAASVVMVVLMAAFISYFSFMQQPHMQPANQIAFKQSYQTEKGEIKQIKLPDGSLLTLNTDSRVTAQFDLNYRNIELEHGELHIKVAHNSEKPLNILVDDKMIQAVGTAFNVQYLAKDDIQLIVSEGKVMLAQNKLLNDKVNFAKLDKPLNQTLLVQAGQKLAIDDAHSINSLKALVEDISANLEVNLSWLSGSLTFSGEPMAEAIAQVNRYLKHPIQLADEVKSIRVIGRFEQGKLDSFLNDLQRNFEVRLSQNSAGEIFLSKK